MIDRLLGKCSGRTTANSVAVVFLTETFSDHLPRSEALFLRAQDANLHLKRRKGSLCRKDKGYLGFLVSATGVRRDPPKTGPIADALAPKDLKGVPCFLGTDSYHRRFAHDCAGTAEPEQQKLAANNPSSWVLNKSKTFQAPSERY